MPELFRIRVGKHDSTLYFLDEEGRLKYKAPLAFGPLRAVIYSGPAFVGLLTEGWVRCSSWKYRAMFGKLEVVCQTEGV